MRRKINNFIKELNSLEFVPVSHFNDLEWSCICIYLVEISRADYYMNGEKDNEYIRSTHKLSTINKSTMNKILKRAEERILNKNNISTKEMIEKINILRSNISFIAKVKHYFNKPPINYNKNTEDKKRITSRECCELIRIS